MLIIKIQNDGTGTVEVGNYRYHVLINQTVIESGAVTGHNRREGWQQLLLDLVKQSNELKFNECDWFTGDSDHEHDDRIL